MFRVKICGITSIADARGAVAAGADAIGLNFYEKSPRSVSPTVALNIGIDIGESARRIGVFVNADQAWMEGVARDALLSEIQLHGEESPEFVAKSYGRHIVWARRMGDGGVAAIAKDLVACKEAGRQPDAVLVDALTPGSYGGTGETVSWSGLADYRKWLGDLPLILAGGLTPDNVAEAIRTVRPHGVDVASGVESSPGQKDRTKMRAFVDAATTAFAALDS